MQYACSGRNSYRRPGRLTRIGVAAATLLAAWNTGTANASISNIVAGISAATYAAAHSSLYVSNGMSRGFTTGSPYRYPANQHDPARDNIHAAFTEAGLVTIRDAFTFVYGSRIYTNCTNVIAAKLGTDTNAGYYIVGGHYDSVNAGPGADDNASGVAAVMEAARVLAPYAFRATLLFIAFDGEEEGLKGSYDFMARRTTAIPNSDNGLLQGIYTGNIKGMISADMIAFNSAVRQNEVLLYGAPSTSGMTPVKTGLAVAIQKYAQGLTWVDEGGSGGSDHVPFSEKGIDAVLLIDDWDNSPYYHMSSDSVESTYNGTQYIDYVYAAKISKALAGYMADQAVLVPTVRLSVPDPAAGEWATNTASFLVTRQDMLTNSVAVLYTVGGSATPTNDYAPLAGSVILSNGCSNAVIVVTPVQDTVAEGTRTVTIQLLADSSYGLSGQTAGQVSIADMPIDAWRFEHFAGADLTNSAISSDLADPDGNGIANLMEYALGRDPRATNRAAVFSADLQRHSNQIFFTALYDRRTNLLDATCWVEVCTNLLAQDWLSGTAHVMETVTATNGPMERVQAQVINPPADAEPQEFLRLKVTRP